MTFSDQKITLTAPYGDGNNYTEGYLIFIDILGFSEFVMSQDFVVIKELFDGFEEFKSDGELSITINQENWKKRAEGEKWTGGKSFKDAFTIISDTLLCFFPDSATIKSPPDWGDERTRRISDQLSILARLSMMVSMFQIKLLSMGLLSRGAVTHGLLHNKDGIWFGPAMIEAHGLEQSNSYPRVVLSPSLTTSLNAEEWTKQQKPMILVDDDEQVYFDYLGWLHTELFAEDFEQGVQKAIEMADQAICQFSDNPRILAKWQWFQTKLQAKLIDSKTSQ